MRRALVTGAHGLVGSALVRALLARGTDVTILQRARSPEDGVLVRDGSRDRCAVVPGDVLDPAALDRALATGCDAVFHLAARSTVQAAERDPIATWEVNVRGSWLLLDACRRHGVGRVLVASSERAYGDRGPRPAQEDDSFDPRSPYDVSKACADLIARSYFRAYDLPVAVLRLGNVYGPGDHNRSRLVPEVVDAVLADRPPVLLSDGTPERGFLYVDDAASAYLVLADALGRRPAGVAGAAFNGGAEQEHSVAQVVQAVLRAAGSDLVPEYRGRRSADAAVDRQRLDCTRLRALGWAPRVSLEEGLRRTVAWHRAHPHRLGSSVHGGDVGASAS